MELKAMYEVTIGIPVYNVEQHLRTTLQSVLAQTFESIEILLCDDCSTDGSVDILKELQQTHPRGRDIHILPQPQNMGVGEARNRIIREAKGRYLYFMDADDLIEPNTIERLYSEAEKNEAEVVYASYEKVDMLHGEDNHTFCYTYQLLDGEDQLAMHFYQEYGRFQTTVWNCLMLTNLLRRANLKFIDASFWEDMAFTYEMVTNVRRAVLLPDVTYHYICRADTLSNYQERQQFSRDEILHNIATINYLKWKCNKLKGKSYLPYTCYNLEMTSFYIVCFALKNLHRIQPVISRSELHFFMRHPLTLREVMMFRHKRLSNLLLLTIGHMPLPLFLLTIRVMGKLKRAI